MGAKIGGIILLVVALGVALYFVQSGGASKIGNVLQPPGAASSTSATATSTTSSTSTGATGAVSAATSSSNAFLTFLNNLFHPQAGSVNIPSAGSGGFNSGGEVYTQGSGSGSSGNGTGSATIPADEIPAGLTLAQLSPYFHDVRFGSVGSQQISLYSYQNYNEPTTTIDITGWEIKTNRGGEYIPRAVNIYNPAGSPVLSDIILSSSQNDQLYFYSNSSPQNLRLNECMGYLQTASYLNQTNQFNPALPDSCPSVNQAAISQFTGACQNYINSLGCQAADLSSPYIPRGDYACQDYLKNNFTYNSCITNHAQDANFLSNTWYIWMGSNPLDPYHDKVELIDKNGLVVDTYNY